MDETEPTYAGALIRSLTVTPLCDHKDTTDLTPEQVAAMHMFKHELLAAYYRMRMVVPEAPANRILSKRLADALTPKQAAKSKR